MVRSSPPHISLLPFVISRVPRRLGINRVSCPLSSSPPAHSSNSEKNGAHAAAAALHRQHLSVSLMAESGAADTFQVFFSTDTISIRPDGVRHDPYNLWQLDGAGAFRLPVLRHHPLAVVCRLPTHGFMPFDSLRLSPSTKRVSPVYPGKNTLESRGQTRAVRGCFELAKAGSRQ